MIAAVAWGWLCRPAVLALAATVLSIGLQGFQYGVGNNEFHIPLVLRLFERPGFAGDWMVQSLPRYVSPVFPLLSLVADEGSLPWWFLGLHGVGRWLAWWGLARIGRACGVGAVEGVVAVAVLVAGPLLYGVSGVGRQDMLPGYFTHTAVAQGLVLVGLACVLEGRLVAACVLAGVAFDVNAFVGIWMAGPLLLGAGAGAGMGRWRRLVLGGILAGVIVAPMLVWIGGVVSGGGAGVEDYRGFLRGYFPFHFFLDASPPWALAELGGVVVAGFLATAGLRLARAVVLGLVAALGAGVLVGVYVSSPLVLNLHLLRVDGCLAMVVAAMAMAAAVRAARMGPGGVAAGGVVVVGVLGGAWLVVAFGLLLVRVASRVASPVREGVMGPGWAALAGRRGVVAALGVAVLVGVGAAGAVEARRGPEGAVPMENGFYMGRWPMVPYWREVALWVRANTPEGSMVLVPPEMGGFRAEAMRPVWVDWKSGAAAMWAPEVAAVWSGRMAALRRLGTDGERLRYACGQGIDYVVVDRRRGAAGVAGVEPVFGNAGFAVYAVRPCLGG